MVSAQVSGRFWITTFIRGPRQSGAAWDHFGTTWLSDTRATGFRESGFSKERRLEPQITIGLLTGQVPAPAFIFSSTAPRVPGTEIAGGTLIVRPGRRVRS
jgi:hypothetical protein